MIKYIMKIVGVMVAVVSFTSFVACSSPESDGKNAAKAFEECEQKYNEDFEDKMRNFVDNFEDYHFTTRTEARAKMDEILAEVSRNYVENIKNAKEQYVKLKSKYIKDYESSKAFEYAFNAQSELNEVSHHGVPLSEEAEEKIKSIIPPKPDVERIKQDLTGHSWQDREDGYFGASKNVIRDGTVRDVKIISQSDQSNVYDIHAVISIQERTGSATYKIDSDIKYILGDADDWTIDYLGSNSVEIEKTGKYEKYISVNKVNWLGGIGIAINNSSDATLIVGGIILCDYPAGWSKFSIEVGPNSSSSLGVGVASRFHNVKEYEIHFVERV